MYPYIRNTRNISHLLHKKLEKIENSVKNLENENTHPMILDFLEWFHQKLEIHFQRKSPNMIMNIWDIFDVELWINVGSELNKTRPCVVVSKAVFNKWNTLIIVPIRSLKKDSKIWSVSFEIQIEETGLFKKSYVTPINIQEISKKRLLKKKWKMQKWDIQKLKKALASIFEIENPLSKW